jgi:DNA-binding FadR family transcriptional regulator
MSDPRIARVTPGVIEFPRWTGRTTTMTEWGADEIAADVARRIVLGEWPKGGKLPTTKQFVAAYEVSETTIYDAMKILKIRNIIRSVRGGGRYVV